MFRSVDLLTLADLKTLVASENPNTRADVITRKLSSYIFSHEGTYYKFDLPTISYKVIMSGSPDDFVVSMTSRYIADSLEALPETESRLFHLEHSKAAKGLSENSRIKSIKEQLRVGLAKDSNPFGACFYQLHYRNGYLNLETMSFCAREVGVHFICCYIDRDYVASTEENRQKVMAVLQQLYTDPDVLDYLLLLFGAGITGKATILQITLFLLGLGSTGKSTLMSILKAALECYTESLESEAFSVSNRNADKTMTTFINKPFIRLIWVNEPKEDKMDACVFKKFCEGVLQAKLLYKNGVHEFTHNGLAVITANTMPNINMDSGVQRRIRSYEHTSNFLDDASLADGKTKFAKNRNLIEDFKRDNLLDAFVDILASYACEWVRKYERGTQPVVPPAFANATAEIVAANDHVQDFIDARLELVVSSDKDNFKVGKHHMIDMYREMYPKRNMSHQVMMPLLKQRGIEYNRMLRAPEAGQKDIKGCFVGVRCKVVEEPVPMMVHADVVPDAEPEPEPEPQINHKALYEEALARIAELEAQLAAVVDKPVEVAKPEPKKRRSRKVAVPVAPVDEVAEPVAEPIEVAPKKRDYKKLGAQLDAFF